MQNRTKRRLLLARNWGIFFGILLIIWIVVIIARPNVNYGFWDKYFHHRKNTVLSETTYTDFIADLCDPDTEVSTYKITDLMAGTVDGITYNDALYILNDRYFIMGEDFDALLETTTLDGYGEVTLVHGAAEPLAALLAAAEAETGQRFTLGESYVDGEDAAAAHGNDCYLLDYYDTSEHITGMSVDLLVPDEDYRTYMRSDLAKWLQNNAWRYGFTVRYPFLEGEYTGVFFQPWHLKYVGKLHAAQLYFTRLSLEEYVTDRYEIDRRTTRFYLTDYTNEDGTVDRYVVYRQTASEGTLFIPDTLRDVEISFDNMTRDYIVTGILDK